VTLGADYESEREHRRGFVNNSGIAGDLRRDETNTLTSTDGYLQFEWTPSIASRSSPASATATFASTAPTTSSSAQSGTTAEKTSYRHTSPAVGVVWHVQDDLNVLRQLRARASKRHVHRARISERGIGPQSRAPAERQQVRRDRPQAFIGKRSA